MTTGKLVTFGDLLALSDVNNNALVNTGTQFFISSLNVKYLDADNCYTLTVRNLQRSVANFAALLVEDCAK